MGEGEAEGERLGHDARRQGGMRGRQAFAFRAGPSSGTADALELHAHNVICPFKLAQYNVRRAPLRHNTDILTFSATSRSGWLNGGSGADFPVWASYASLACEVCKSANIRGRAPTGRCRHARCDARRAPILMSPDINWPFWPFPRHSSRGLMSGARLCWPGFGAGFVPIPMEKPPTRHVPRQKTAATRPFYPQNKIRPLDARLRGHLP